MRLKKRIPQSTAVKLARACAEARQWWENEKRRVDAAPWIHLVREALEEAEEGE
jgi:hypothetical protein